MKSRETLRNERIIFQTKDILAGNKAEKEALEAARAKKNADLMESATVTAGEAARRSRMKTEEVARRLTYPEHFTELALSECLGFVCDHALLLDEDAYAALEPDYKAKMRSTIRSFLENGDVEVSPASEATKDVLAAIGKNMPDPKQFLKEEDEKELINSKIISDPVINRDLLAMSGDVRRRVANRVETDQAALSAQQDDIDYAADKEAQAAPVVPAPAATDPFAQAPEEAPLPDPDAPADDQAAAPAEPAPAVAESMKLNIAHERKAVGVIDTLALNEGMDMVKDGKPFDASHALANAIRYVTCLEALDDSGLVHIGTPGYNRILSRFGTSMNISKRTDIPFSDVSSAPIGTAPAAAADASKPGDIDLKQSDDLVGSLPASDPKEKEARAQLSDIINSAFPKGMISQPDSGLFKPYAEWKAEHAKPTGLPDKLAESISAPAPEQDLKGKFTDIHGKVYTEDELYEYFETQGFYGLTESDFESLWHSWNFHKH